MEGTARGARHLGSYLLVHRHPREACSVAFAAWRGFHSPLRHRTAICSCRRGGHEVWWVVQAASAAEALALLPPYVGERTRAVAVDEIEIP